MPQLTLALRTVTPLITMGAANDPRDPAELRAAPFRGLFRYWLRALLGTQAQADMETLSDFESMVFGRTDLGSPITVRVREIGDKLPIGDGQRVLPTQFQFKAFQPEGELRMTLTTHPLSKGFPPVMFGAVLLALRLGSVGRRARRGGGALTIMKAVYDAETGEGTKPSPTLHRRPDSGDKLVAHLREDIEFALARVPNIQTRRPFGDLPTYPVLLEEHSKVLVGPHCLRYEDALQAMWRIRTRDAFHGDPLFGSVRPRRRASPVHMRVSVTTQGENITGYFPVMTIFRSLPESKACWGVMQQFVDECASQGFQVIYGEEERWD